ncbi:helix-turn-helix domain-containing protein [Pannonibacter indicus]|uniref:helix-turn-helix domain-containing protein n=1 Tax=Pannonibacter indicus TaxID=466044 RepID=UPI00391A6BB2
MRLPQIHVSALYFPFGFGIDTKSSKRAIAVLSIPKVSVRQVKAARALLDWSQSDLALRSGVSEPTIKRIEASDGPLGGRSDTVGKIISALQQAGIIFVSENGEGPGVRLRKGVVQ